ncbi:MAG: hypothetical protein K6G51_04085 [Sphaerochaetaceae bacterium]|nr:hypothetical protein [Sphaerochaetaceae bacterium]
MKEMIYGFLAGAAVAVIVFIVMKVQALHAASTYKKEIEKYKKMLADKMEIEQDGITKLKEENEKLKNENNNLKISVQTWSQKPGRKEIQRLQVYQTAADRLTINAPGFGPAWQTALKESEKEFEQTFLGVQPFLKKLIPTKTDASVIKELDE